MFGGGSSPIVVLSKLKNDYKDLFTCFAVIFNEETGILINRHAFSFGNFRPKYETRFGQEGPEGKYTSGQGRRIIAINRSQTSPYKALNRRHTHVHATLRDTHICTLNNHGRSRLRNREYPMQGKVL